MRDADLELDDWYANSVRWTCTDCGNVRPDDWRFSGRLDDWQYFVRLDDGTPTRVICSDCQKLFYEKARSMPPMDWDAWFDSE